jgi:branched-chain amino acid transport system ATP-binding protein
MSGLLRPAAGEIRFDGRAAHLVPAHERVKLGIAQSPEGRRIFGTLTVRENLMLGAFTREGDAEIAETARWVYSLFPVLEKRREQLAGTLSGGEQQMLAIGRALMAKPRVLLLDEPSLGLAPLLVKAIFQTIREINRSAGVTVLLVEQNARAALKLAHRGYVMEVGRIVLENRAEILASDPKVQSAYLGGHAAKPA